MLISIFENYIIHTIPKYLCDKMFLLRSMLRIALIAYLVQKFVLPSLNGIGGSMDGLLQPRLLNLNKDSVVDIMD